MNCSARWRRSSSGSPSATFKRLGILVRIDCQTEYGVGILEKCLLLILTCACRIADDRGDVPGMFVSPDGAGGVDWRVTIPDFTVNRQSISVLIEDETIFEQGSPGRAQVLQHLRNLSSELDKNDESWEPFSADE